MHPFDVFIPRRSWIHRERCKVQGKHGKFLFMDELKDVVTWTRHNDEEINGVVDASDLGLTAGTWPETLNVRDEWGFMRTFTRLGFEFDNFGELLSTRYGCSPRSIVVFND